MNPSYASNWTPPKIRGMIESLSSQVHRLFRLAIDSYVDQNVGLASALDDMDDEIDKLHVDFIESIFETHESGTLPLQVAMSFYEKHGYRRSGKVTDFFSMALLEYVKEL